MGDVFFYLYFKRSPVHMHNWQLNCRGRDSEKDLFFGKFKKRYMIGFPEEIKPMGIQAMAGFIRDLNPQYFSFYSHIRKV